MIRNTILIAAILLISITAAISQTAVAPASGNGMANTPYEIASLDNLYWLSISDTAWDKHFIQTTNIDALQTAVWDSNKGFSPIGDTITQFTGTYNGKGYIIDRLKINREIIGVGFFGCTKTAVIDSLGLTDVNFHGKNSVGGLAGVAYFNTSINNCFVAGSIYGDNNVGGLVGLTNLHTSINRCFTTGSIHGDNNVGGLVGYNYNYSTISSSYSTCNVSHSSYDEYYIGGLVGSNTNHSTISRCYCKGNVLGYKYVGGFVGRNNSSSEINNCYSSGDISIISGGSRIGGFIGENNSTVNNSYCYGNNTHFALLYSGGFVGEDFGTINNSFFDISVTSETSSNGVNSASTSEMQEMCLFVDGNLASWDFIGENINGTGNIWGININENGGYPFLKFQEFTHTGICCTFNDIEAPTFISNNIEIFLNSNGNNTINNSDILTDVQDNCSVESTTISQTTFTCNDIGVNDVYITVTDEAGNETLDTVQITVTDNITPTLSCPVNQNISVNEFDVYPVNGTEFDPTASSDNCEIASIENNYNNSNTLSGEILNEGMHQITWTITDNNANETTCTFIITASGYTGVEELEENRIEIYPNPAKKFIMLKNLPNNKKSNIYILDITGKSIKSIIANTSSIKLDISDLENGIYFVKIEELVNKFVKE